MPSKFRDYEINPIDISNDNDLIELINNIVGLKIRSGYFKRWSKQALLSEGWIQILSLKEKFNPSKNVPFNKYAYMYLPVRISDGMAGFEEGMGKFVPGSNRRWTHRAHQFPEDSFYHSNPAYSACIEDTFAQHKETIEDRVDNCLGLNQEERLIVSLIGKGTTMKAIGQALGVTESRVSQRCKIIRRKINE